MDGKEINEGTQNSSRNSKPLDEARVHFLRRIGKNCHYRRRLLGQYGALRFGLCSIVDLPENHVTCHFSCKLVQCRSRQY